MERPEVNVNAILDSTSPMVQVGSKRSRRGLRISVIAGLVAVIAVLVGVKANQISAMVRAGKSFVPPPESVTTAKVESTQWQASRAAVGSLVAIHGVTLGAELPGIIRKIGFESGTSVQRGALLVQLDTSTEEAQLAAAVADAELARVSLVRAQQLRKTGSNTEADLDAADARAKQTEATVEGLRATIAKKTIRAPFDGRIAIRQVELGQSVSPGTALASLQSVSPIYAEFSLPQQALSDLKLGQEVHLQTDTFPGASWDGSISTINSEIDVATRNVRVRATFPNQNGRLRPGMFVKVDVVSAERRPVLLIPATSVIYAPYGDSVFVVEQKDGSPRARQKFVRVGERRGDLVAVETGVEPSATVVSSGAFKLRNGMSVVVNNQLAPKVQVAPQPTDK